MPHRTTLWRRRTGKVSPKAKAGRNEGGSLSEVNEILDFWRLTNILTLWVKIEWQSGNANQTIVTRGRFPAICGDDARFNQTSWAMLPLPGCTSSVL